MTEFHIIGLGNLCEFVIKDIDNNRTHGVFSACDKHDRKSMQEFVDYVNQLIKENEQLQQELFDSECECIEVHYHDNGVRRAYRIEDLKKEFKERFGRDFE